MDGLNSVRGFLVLCVLSLMPTWAEDLPPMADGGEDRQRSLRVELMQREDGSWALPLADLAAFGWQLPNEAALPVFEQGGQRFVPVSALEEGLIRVNERDGYASFQAEDLFPVEEGDSTQWQLPISLNSQIASKPHPLIRTAGHYYLPPETMEALGISLTAIKPNSAGHYSLDALADGFYWLDLSRPQLTLWIRTSRFKPYRIERKRAEPLVPQRGYSVLLDYRLTEGIDEDAERWRTGYFDAAVSAGTAYCETQHLYRSTTEMLTRLGSRCVLDRPRSLVSLVLGDTFTSGSVLGQTVSYGGVRLGTNTQLVPSWVTRPRPSLRGAVLTPAMLEVWINENLVTQEELPPGEFELYDLPAASGVSEILSRIEDSTGVPITQRFAFYSDSSLLAQGLSEWSLSYGHRRAGVVDGEIQYDESPFALVTGRYGVNNRLTMGGRVELFDTGRVSGGTTHWGLGPLGMLDLGGALSINDETLETGSTWLWAFSRRASKLSFRYQEQRTDDTFIQLGSAIPNRMPEIDKQLTFGWSVRKGVSLSLGRFEREYRTRADYMANNATLGLTWSGRGSLRLSALDVIEPQPRRQYSVSFTLALGKGRSLMAGATGEELENRGVTYQYNSPGEGGYGYRLHAGVQGEVEVQDAEVNLDGSLASLRLYGERRDGEPSGFAELSGALVLNEAGAFLSRNPAGSYTVVDAGVPDVRVYKNNRLVGVTDNTGRLLVPGLKPYTRNRLRLSGEDLPVSASVAEPTLKLVPGNRQVLTARFDVTFDRKITARLVDPDQNPIPAGTSVLLAGSQEALTVGHDGLLYADVGSRRVLVGRARLGDQRLCEFDVPLDGVESYPADLGTVICEPL